MGSCGSNSRTEKAERQSFTLPVFPVNQDGAALEGSNVKPEYKLSVIATKPKSGDPPFPTVVFINGFQCQAPWYYHYADRLAESGMMVLQYTTPSLSIIKDNKELTFVDQLLTWADVSNQQPGHFLHGSVDFNALGIAGHSRGAKLAALHYTRDCRFRAALLLDPVNNTTFTPESVEYPNACKALEAAGRPVGIVGAGVMGGGNPEGSNWKNFYASSPPGSWLAVLPTAGHMNFAKPAWLWKNLLNAVAGGAGQLSPDQILDASAPLMIAWFRKFLTPNPSSIALPFTHQSTGSTVSNPQKVTAQVSTAGLITTDSPLLPDVKPTAVMVATRDGHHEGKEDSSALSGGEDVAWPFQIPQNPELSKNLEHMIKGLQATGSIDLRWH